MLHIAKHPCFNAEVKGECGRVHLPVAPRCNVLCNYCNRKFDCVTESRPGVTSAVLTPQQALVYVEQVLAAEPRITVAGIAVRETPLPPPGKPWRPSVWSGSGFRTCSFAWPPTGWACRPTSRN